MSKYEALYKRLRLDILDGNYRYKEKLPSIREMEKNTGLSRTTIEAAYGQLLVEGYIVSRHKSGYFVDVDLKQKQEMAILKQPHCPYLRVHYDYDFSGGAVDPSSFNMELWKKYIRQALQEQESLYEYGQQQGELVLRQALCHYTSMYRGVHASEEQMVIGSGFQALLTILCGLLKNVKRVGMPRSGFLHAQMIFSDFNIETIMLEEDEDGIVMDSLYNVEIDFLYLNTSSAGQKSGALPISRRLQIIEYAKAHSIFIIEDDHNGELRYSAKPVPAMQGQDPEHIIYIGSFSKLMVPSLRIAYMVLPLSLLDKYSIKRDYYHQNVSKLEQIALAYFIEDGQLIRQLKRLRRLYSKKSRMLIDSLNLYFDHPQIQLEETALRVRVTFQFLLDAEGILKNAHEHGIDLQIQQKQCLLSFSSISLDKIEEGIKQLSKIILTQ